MGGDSPAPKIRTARRRWYRRLVAVKSRFASATSPAVPAGTNKRKGAEVSPGTVDRLIAVTGNLLFYAVVSSAAFGR